MRQRAAAELRCYARSARHSRLLTIIACFVAGAVLCPARVVAQTVEESLKHRPVSLPTLEPGDDCPVTTGSRGTVPSQRHIFGGALWFGAGPVYFALAWKATPGDDATFALEPVPREGDAHRAKTPWVAAPTYSGPILVRGSAIDASRRALRFDATGAGPRNALELKASASASSRVVVVLAFGCVRSRTRMLRRTNRYVWGPRTSLCLKLSNARVGVQMMLHKVIASSMALGATLAASTGYASCGMTPAIVRNDCARPLRSLSRTPGSVCRLAMHYRIHERDLERAIDRVVPQNRERLLERLGDARLREARVAVVAVDWHVPIVPWLTWAVRDGGVQGSAAQIPRCA